MHPMFDPEVRCLRLEECPAVDQSAWAATLAPSDLLELDIKVASGWSAGTRRKTMNGYGRWLGWLSQAGTFDGAAQPANRATRAQVKAYLAMLKQRGYAPYTISGRIQDLGNALRAMEPQQDWTWIAKAAGRLHSQAAPAKDLTKRMRPAQEVLSLAFRLMTAADADSTRSELDNAILYRDGLAIAALMYRPLRITNLAGVQLGRHLLNCGSDWRLKFAAEETKARQPIECPWPKAITPHLVRYLAVHRPVLLDQTDVSSQGALWVSKGGAGMTASVLGYRIEKRTKDSFGTPVNPHTFRHIAATTIATLDPENATGIAAILGHSCLETSEKHYIKARALEASNTYTTALTEIRRGSNGNVRSYRGSL